ncbi:MAG: multiheme c-type cytochrome (seleno)protein ExtKL, partial [Thermodesulfobacteriota bacterium]
WKKAYNEGKTDLAWDLEDKIASLNINCVVCHNKLPLIHKWEHGYPQPDTLYGPNEGGSHYHPDFNKMAKAPGISEPIFCGQCHGLGPNFEFDHPSQCATLYGSYLYAYLPEGGTEGCQECHMKKSGLGHDMQAYRS